MGDWKDEIVELHEFFQRWFRGEIASAERMESVLAPDFTMVGPDGAVMDRDAIVGSVMSHHGTRPIRLWTSDHKLLAERSDMVVARYVESYERDDATRARVSTVVFRKDSATPNGLSWLTVHETWSD